MLANQHMLLRRSAIKSCSVIQRFNKITPPTRPQFPVDFYADLRPKPWDKMSDIEKLEKKNRLVFKEDADPYFTPEVGSIPFLYNEEAPIEVLKEAVANDSLTEDDARKYLRFLRKRNPTQALEALKYISSQYIALDSDFFSKFIYGLCKPETATEAYQSFQILLEKKKENPQLVEYAKQLNGPKSWEKIQKAVDVTTKRVQLQLNSRVHYKLFKVLSNPEVGMWEEAVRVYHESLPETQGRFTGEDFHLVIEWHLQQDDLNAALTVHQQMHLHSYQMSAALTYRLMKACYDAKRPRSALNIYDMAYPKPLTYKNQNLHSDSPAALLLALQICSEHNLISRAAFIYDRSGADPTEEIITLLVHILARHPSTHNLCWKVAKDAESTISLVRYRKQRREKYAQITVPVDHELSDSDAAEAEIEKGAKFTWTLPFVNSLLNASTNLEQIREVLDSLRANKVEPTIATYNVLLKKIRELKSGREFLDRREFQQMEKDVRSYDVLIQHSFKVSEKIQEFKEMNSKQMKPLVDTLNYLLDSFLQQTMKPEDTLKFLDVAGVSPLPSSDVTVDDVLTLFKHYDISPNSETHQVIMNNSNENGKYDDTIQHYYQLVESGTPLTSGIGNLALWAFVEMRDQTSAQQLYQTMREKRIATPQTHLIMNNTDERSTIDAITEYPFTTHIRPFYYKHKTDLMMQDIIQAEPQERKPIFRRFTLKEYSGGYVTEDEVEIDNDTPLSYLAEYSSKQAAKDEANESLPPLPQ